jgi:uncharacterized protein (DUF305 family)
MTAMGLNKTHFISLLSYVGIGLLATGISYGFFSNKASIIFIILGFCLFIIAQLFKKNESTSWFQLLLFGIVFTISIGMIIGGILYFGSRPELALWIIPTGFLVSWLVFGIRYKWENFTWVSALGGIFTTALLSAAVYGLIMYLPTPRYVQSDHTNTQSTTGTIATGSRLEKVQNIIFWISNGNKATQSGAILWMENLTESEIRERCIAIPTMEGCDMFINTVGSGTNSGSIVSTGTEISHNHADMVNSEVDFVALMIPHHQEAVDSTISLLNVTQNPTLQYLGNNIVTSQQEEIQMMQERLSGIFAGRTYTGIPYMPMMREIRTISSTQTAEKMWLEDMVAHHQGAVDMAKKVLTLSPRQEIKTFAENIIKVQSDEIKLMNQLLSNY